MRQSRFFIAMVDIPNGRPGLRTNTCFTSSTARPVNGTRCSAPPLHGIDAVELHQTCEKNGANWACGDEAKTLLARLVAGSTVNCEQRDIDKYDRVVAVCSSGGRDLGQALVEAGLAVALPSFSTAYVGAEAKARAQRVGIWASEFEMPSAYRADHPRPEPTTRRVPLRLAPAPVPTATGAYFANCRQAWAAGAAPIYRGQPGY